MLFSFDLLLHILREEKSKFIVFVFIIPLTAGVEGPLKGLGSSVVLDALSCYLSITLKHSDTKRDTETPYSLFSWGGGARQDPPLIAYLYKNINLMQWNSVRVALKADVH